MTTEPVDLIVLVRDTRVAIVKLGAALYVIANEGDAPGFQRLDNEFVDLPDNSLGLLLGDCVDELDANDGWLDPYGAPDEHAEAAFQLLAWMREQDWFEGAQREEDAAQMVRAYLNLPRVPMRGFETARHDALREQVEGWIERVLQECGVLPGNTP